MLGVTLSPASHCRTDELLVLGAALGLLQAQAAQLSTPLLICTQCTQSAAGTEAHGAYGAGGQVGWRVYCAGVWGLARSCRQEAAGRTYALPHIAIVCCRELS